MLLLLKQWEQKRIFLYYRLKREQGDRIVLQVFNFLRVIPHASLIFLSRFFHILVFYISTGVLQIVRFLERKLLRFVNMVKGRQEVHHKKGAASLFLVAISDKNRESRHSG